LRGRDREGGFSGKKVYSVTLNISDSNNILILSDAETSSK